MISILCFAVKGFPEVVNPSIRISIFPISSEQKNSIVALPVESVLMDGFQYTVDLKSGLRKSSLSKCLIVLKDVAGFIGNRLQHALWREAFSLIDEGICDAETVDIAVRNSFGLRLPALGPVANADLVGLALTLAIHDYVLPHLNASPLPSSTLRAHVAANELGFKSKQGFLEWTDESIAATRNRLTTYLLEVLSKKKAASKV